jgi:putative glycosyltransferase (TIGR04348 family)
MVLSALRMMSPESLMHKLSIVIVTPALADANNGNWQTAKRWAAQLSHMHRTRIVASWTPAASGHHHKSDDVLIALHARRSADSIAAWHALRGSRGLVLAMTGTDLYRDIGENLQARGSLDKAQTLVVLQEQGLKALPAQYRHKARVIFQSTTSRQSLPKTPKHLHAVMVGHLRAEKAPETLFEAARALRGHSDIRITHIGNALDAQLGYMARDTAAECPRYEWTQGLAHSLTRARIQRAHVLVHTSRMEGGAHVVMEAVCSGTPVLASRIDGNVGMLGQDYAGYFEVGRGDQLATLLVRCKNEPAFLDHLNQQCAARAPLFTPQAEQQHWLELIQSLQL